MPPSPTDTLPPPSPSESPSPGPSPSPAAGASPTSATGSSSGSRFDVDPGPRFDEDGRPPADERAAPAIDVGELPASELWQEDRLKRLLMAQGMVLHTVAAVDKASTEWVYTQNDLAAIAPPLTAILNRYDATRAAAAAGDELALLVGLGGYVARSYRERRHALDALGEPLQPVPTPGVRQPHEDPEWAAQTGYIPDPDTDPAPIRNPRR
jgi:hypothetical protein